ncbi:hypothetical protein ACHAWF_016643 [Thalassiosira exigua]
MSRLRVSARMTVAPVRNAQARTKVTGRMDATASRLLGACLSAGPFAKVCGRECRAEPLTSQLTRGGTSLALRAAQEPSPRTALPLVRSSSVEEELNFDRWEDDDDDDAEEGGGDAPAASEGGGGGAASRGDGTTAAASAAGKPPPKPKPTFATLGEAIRSDESTFEDVRDLYAKHGVREEDRARLWTKVICGKTLENVEDGSLADSYREWAKREAEKEVEEGADGDDADCGVDVDALLEQACGILPGHDDYPSLRRDVLLLSRFHGLSHAKGGDGDGRPSSGIDPLVPPCALALLRAGLPPPVASVALSRLAAASCPLLRLGRDERREGCAALCAEFYLVACYHLPLLVVHLDRHCPGWHLPRGDGDESATADGKEEEGGGEGTDDGEEEKGTEEKGEGDGGDEGAGEEAKAPDAAPAEKAEGKRERREGLVPASWFASNFAGECGVGVEGGEATSCLGHRTLLPLWDDLLVRSDPSRRHLLAAAVLDRNSDALLMSRGDELRAALGRALAPRGDPDFAEESFVGGSGLGEGGDGGKTDDVAYRWLSSARDLAGATPSSVLARLRTADDRAVAAALEARRAKTDEELRAREEAEEASRKRDREQRDKEAERALHRARLTAYYRKHNPEKVDTIDQIMKLFDGRMGVLDAKLKNKYGQGFLPEEALKDQTRSFLMSVNQSIADTRKHVSVAVAERRKRRARTVADGRPHAAVVLEVSATEVIPIVCTTKARNLTTGKKMDYARRTSNAEDALQFYLVDCRPESIAAEQGRFPTSVALSPEKLQDPDELQKLTDMFESLRGAVHICVMGEGFASFPVLYNHSLSKAEEKLLEDDIARTSNCALFFLKKGFPFVSLLRGGFAAAHAFLSRNGPTMGMAPPEVLIDYDEEASLFAQLETDRQEEDRLKNAPAREKTARTLQKIIDSSMTRLTIEEQRINELAHDLARPETVDKMKQSASNLLARAAKAKPKTVRAINFGRTPPLFVAKFGSPKGTPVVNEEEDAGAEKENTGNIKLPSLHSASSSTACSGKESGANEEGYDSETPASEPSQTPKVENAPEPNLAVSNESKSPSDEATKEGVQERKLTFSSFASRFRDPKVSYALKDSTLEKATANLSLDKEKDVSSASEGPSKASIAFASFTQRVQQSTTTAAAAAGSEQPTSKTGTSEKESSVSQMSFSSFANRIKVGQQSPQNPKDKPADARTSEEASDSATDDSKDSEPKQGNTPAGSSDVGKFTKLTMSIGSGLSGLREKATEVSKDRKEKEEADQETSGGGEVGAEAKSGSETEKDTHEESKQAASTDNPVVGGRFAKFTKSIGGGLSGLRERAAVVPEKNEVMGSVAETSEGKEVKKITSTDTPSADGGRFTNFTTSFGGGFSGLRSQTRQNPSSSISSSNPESSAAGPPASAKGSQGDETGSMAKSLTALTQTSIGKMLLQDEPRPMTRFQRLAAEESISFDEETATASSTDSQKAGELGDLYFADVSLDDVAKPSDAEDKKPADGGDAGEPTGNKA